MAPAGSSGEVTVAMATPLILTPGDPAGIGAEITLKAHAAGERGFAIIEDPRRLATLADRLSIDAKLRIIDTPGDISIEDDHLPVIPLEWPQAPCAGIADPRNAPTVIESIRRAATWARDGSAAAMVTNPVNKAVLQEAGFAHPGHTEFLATLSAPHDGAPAMMLACDELRVVPVTIHMALRDVPDALTGDDIVSKGMLLAESLRRDFSCANPRIAVCGLNPHAGENGQFGDEDEQVIAPAVVRLQAAGIRAFGPVSADTLFHRRARETYDGVLGMYHDQVLIPIKTLDFDGGVNVTLGLDFIRTSPDHGTAFDIAGTGTAQAGSLIAALRMARLMARNRHAGS
jgi:4-hydroxythreonine-4-phosphate dehydrogenase